MYLRYLIALMDVTVMPANANYNKDIVEITASLLAASSLHIAHVQMPLSNKSMAPTTAVKHQDGGRPVHEAETDRRRACSPLFRKAVRCYCSRQKAVDAAMLGESVRCFHKHSLESMRGSGRGQDGPIPPSPRARVLWGSTKPAGLRQRLVWNSILASQCLFEKAF